MGHEDLRGPIAASEIDDGLGHIGSAKHLRFDLQAPGEPKMLLNGFSFSGEVVATVPLSGARKARCNRREDSRLPAGLYE
ncbi:MAG TPA: hypothetical protein VN780_15360 [Candidatus Eisenbacteria bacterium]|jgi:hypothetical protein|nr:hypothetical protein [Candidatus Eisenbacteria bacterium]